MKTKSNFKLIASHSSADDLAALIKSRWLWNDVLFATVDEGKTYHVMSGGKVIEGLRVICKGGRWRLERAVLP